MQWKQLRLGSGWMILAALAFALMSLFVKLGASEFNSLELLFWRTLIGAVCLLYPILIMGQSPKTEFWKGHISRAVLGYLSMSLLFYSLTILPLSTAVTLNYTSSLAFSALCMIRLKDKPSPIVKIALVLGFIGVVLLLKPTLNSDQWLAGLMGFASGISAGFAIYEVRELGRMGEASWRIVFWFFVLSSILGFVIVLLGPGFSPVQVSWSSLGSLVGIGVMGMAGQLCMTRAYKVGRKYLVASFAYLTVIFSALLGTWFGAETINQGEIFAMLLIILAGLLAARSR